MKAIDKLIEWMEGQKTYIKGIYEPSSLSRIMGVEDCLAKARELRDAEIGTNSTENQTKVNPYELEAIEELRMLTYFIDHKSKELPDAAWSLGVIKSKLDHIIDGNIPFGKQPPFDREAFRRELIVALLRGGESYTKVNNQADLIITEYERRQNDKG